jgi:hypothetical protein
MAEMYGSTIFINWHGFFYSNVRASIEKALLIAEKKSEAVHLGCRVKIIVERTTFNT